MAAKVGYSTPLLHVKSVEESMRFYELLGFTAVDTDRSQPLGWARLHCEGGALMFLRAEEPVDASRQAIFLYMYTPDLAALRNHLLANGVAVSPLRHPEYMPSGEMTVSDPDNYRILVAHWGEAEHATWQMRISAQNGKGC